MATGAGRPAADPMMYFTGELSVRTPDDCERAWKWGSTWRGIQMGEGMTAESDQNSSAARPAHEHEGWADQSPYVWISLGFVRLPAGWWAKDRGAEPHAVQQWGHLSEGGVSGGLVNRSRDSCKRCRDGVNGLCARWTPATPYIDGRRTEAKHAYRIAKWWVEERDLLERVG